MLLDWLRSVWTPRTEIMLDHGRFGSELSTDLRQDGMLGRDNRMLRSSFSMFWGASKAMSCYLSLVVAETSDKRGVRSPRCSFTSGRVPRRATTVPYSGIMIHGAILMRADRADERACLQSIPFVAGEEGSVVFCSLTARLWQRRQRLPLLPRKRRFSGGCTCLQGRPARQTSTWSPCRMEIRKLLKRPDKATRRMTVEESGPVTKETAARDGIMAGAEDPTPSKMPPHLGGGSCCLVTAEGTES